MERGYPLSVPRWVEGQKVTLAAVPAGRGRKGNDGWKRSTAMN